MSEPFLLAHLSDLHLPPPGDARGVWPPKRALSRLSWRLRRRRLHLERVAAAVAEDLGRAGPDHVAVTGDLTNFGLAGEYARAAAWLARLGDAAAVTAIPGNHDAMAAGAAEAGFGPGGPLAPFAAGDGGARGWPVLRRRGPLALIGVSSGVPSPPFRATGRIGADQCARLAGLLAATQGLCRVVLVHHPPDQSAPARKALTDRAALQTVLACEGAELVLHGHLHVSALAALPGPGGRAIPCLGAPSASMAPGRGPARAAGWTALRVSGEPGGWRIALEARRLGADGRLATTLRLDL